MPVKPHILEQDRQLGTLAHPPACWVRVAKLEEGRGLAGPRPGSLVEGKGPEEIFDILRTGRTRNDSQCRSKIADHLPLAHTQI
jgi:hypothetical protein